MLSSLPSVLKSFATWCARAMTTMLELVGCGALTTAAYQVDPRLGYLVAGLLSISLALLIDLGRAGKRKT